MTVKEWQEADSYARDILKGLAYEYPFLYALVKYAYMQGRLKGRAEAPQGL